LPLDLFGVLSKLYLPLVLESVVHAYLIYAYIMGGVTFFDPIYRVKFIKA
jgi:hypothetical protein